MQSYQFEQYGGPIRATSTPTPKPTGSEVVLTVDACGVCHSDVHVWDGFFSLGGDRKLDVSASRELPFTLGHEIAGTVVAVGPAVTEVQPGDRVVAFPWIGCGSCAFCTDGREHLCFESRALGTHVDGGFADTVIVPHERYLFDYGTIPTDLAATYACSGLAAYSALLKVQDYIRSRLIIIGVGGVGMAGLQIARHLYPNAEKIVVDVDDLKLEAAHHLGAHHTINANTPGAGRELRRLTEGGCEAVVDFVGSEESATQGLRVVAKGGILVIVGLMGGTLAVPLPLVPLKDLTIKGSDLGSLAEMRGLMSLVNSGAIEAIPIETRSMSRVQETLEQLRNGTVLGRVVLKPQ